MVINIADEAEQRHNRNICIALIENFIRIVRNQYAGLKAETREITDILPDDRRLKGSATQGNSFAQYTLGKLYLLGHEVQADREEALRYFAQSAAQGNTYAQYFIDHQDDFSGAAAGTAILRMLHQMSRIFRENAAQPAIYAGMQIDKKRRRRLQEKRMAIGHKADDHEDRGLTQQTQ